MRLTLNDFGPGRHYHVFNRGNSRQVVFRDAADRQFFLAKLDEVCERFSLTLLAYCLMDNHYHLAMRQDSWASIPKAMQALGTSYSQMYNRKYGALGPLFQSRFCAVSVADEGQMANLTRYIHRNPEPFKDFRKYRWSSYRQFVGDSTGIATPGPVLDTFAGSKTYYAMFCEKAPLLKS
jgi:REP element-mobilizing transposase RayT